MYMMEVSEKLLKSVINKYSRIEPFITLSTTKPVVLDAHRLLKKDIEKLKRMIDNGSTKRKA